MIYTYFHGVGILEGGGAAMHDQPSLRSCHSTCQNVHARIYIYSYIHKYVYTYVCIYICIRICSYSYLYTSIYNNSNIYSYVLNLHPQLVYIHIYNCT